MDTMQPTILAIDTATPATSLAITKGVPTDGAVIGSVGLSSNVTHSRRLLSSIDWLMTEVGVGWEEIDAVGVSLGPGSFTGLRIGMATAKGLVAAAGKKLVGVSTLDALAGKCVSQRLICSVLDARKKEVYAALYRSDTAGNLQRVGDIEALAPEKLAERIEEPVVMIGDGAVVYKQLFEESLGDDLTIVPAALHEPSAAFLGMACGSLFQKGQFLDIGSAVPLYVRSSDAELNLKKKQEALAAAKAG